MILIFQDSGKRERFGLRHESQGDARKGIQIPLQYLMGKCGEFQAVKQELFDTTNMSRSGIYTSVRFSCNAGETLLPSPFMAAAGRQQPKPFPGKPGVTPAEMMPFLLIK